MITVECFSGKNCSEAAVIMEGGNTQGESCPPGKASKRANLNLYEYVSDTLMVIIFNI